MRFKRPQVRYSDTPEPVTPYQAAAQAWDHRIGQARVQASNWRFMAGQVRAVGEAATPYQPSDAQIAFHLARFITDVRSLSIDPIVVRQNWLEAYDYTTDRGAATLNDHARATDPFARIGQQSIAVQVNSVVRASDSSFQLRWTERRYVNGEAAGLERWTAVLSTVLQAPRTEERLRKNPLGIYVNGLSWSRELDATEGVKTP